MAVCKALPMGMRHHINWQSIYIFPEISSMIRIKATQKNLFRFPASLVLANYNSGNNTQHFLGIIHPTHLNISSAYRFIDISCVRSNNYILQFNLPVAKWKVFCFLIMQ